MVKLLDLTIILLIIAGIAHLALGLVVATNNPKAVANQIMLSFSVVAALWGLSVLIITINDSYTVTLFWIRMSHALGLVAPWHILALTNALFQKDVFALRSVKTTFILSAVFALLALTPYLIEGIEEPYVDNIIIYGILTYPFIAFIITFVAYTLWQVFNKMKISRGKVRIQLYYLFTGTLLTALSIIMVNILLPYLGVIYLYGIDIRATGPVFSLIMIGSISYAIIKYRFMDIRFALRKNINSLAAALIISFISVFLFRVLVRLNTVQDTWKTDTLVALAVFFIVLSLPYVKEQIKLFFNRFIYKNVTDYHVLLIDSTRELLTVLEKEALINHLTGNIVRYMNLEYGINCIRKNDQYYALEGYTCNAKAPTEPAIEGSKLNPIIGYINEHRNILVQSDLTKSANKFEYDYILGLFITWGIDVAVPLVNNEVLEGVLFLGAKNSGEPFYNEDIALLAILATQVQAGLINASLYKEISDIKQYQEKILSKMGNGLLAVNESGIITVYNSEAEKLLGKSAAGVVGKNVSEALGEVFCSLFNETLLKNTGISQYEIVLGAGNELIHLSCNTSIVASPESTLNEVVIVLSDVTRIKELESEKNKAQRLASLGEIAAGIAHEIKNPLVSIKTFANLLPDKYDDHEFRNSFSNIVSQEITRINNLVGEMLNLAKEPVLNLDEVRLTSLIDEVIALLTPQLEAQGISVKLENEQEYVVTVDRALLKQALLNICVNAVHAMPEGGILRVGVYNIGSVLHLFIEDNGVGIPEKIRDKIFDPFVTNKADGVGIGLSISHKIISDHGGRIALSSFEGAGSRFEITLPSS